ncbi:uncharacterized protein [Typha latifolia]|uniref:uncharacterized protein isoform X2 n=1 Tax=Typha latifolia TaxID=4733 RepID=UPI003C2C3321
MEAAAGRGGSLPVSSSSSQPPARKEWRAVAEHPFRANGSEESEHGKLGESDERTIYEEGRGPLDVDFCSITIDGAGGLNDDILQQRLQSVVRQREELQHMEIELKAQAIARSEILEVQHSFEAQIKEQAAAATKLKEQLQEREKHILELEMKLEEKDRELHAVKIDNEAAWAKEDLLREQNKELATFRRERDNTENERAQHLKQIHDLQDHIHEKENQFLALEEQHRVAQETVLYKDEQLREAQAWLSRAQEMDALHSTTNQTLQAELRERTEQFNQYWINFQRQFAEMERHHLQAIQQLQLELAEARERNGRYKDDSRTACENPEDPSCVQIKGNKNNVNDGGTGNANLGIIANGNVDGASSFIAASSASTMALPPSLLGSGAFLPPGQISAMHPYMMHPQGLPQPATSTNSLVPQSQLGHIQPLTAISDHQHLQNQQAVPDVSRIPNQTKQQTSQTDQNVLRSDAAYNYQLTAERQVVHPDHLSSHVNQQQRSDHIVSGSSEEVQGKQKEVTEEPEKILDANSRYNSSLNLDPLEKKSEPKVEGESTMAVPNQSQDLVFGQQHLASTVVGSTAQNNSLSSNGASECNKNMINYAEVPNSSGRTSRSLLPGKAEPSLLDERALLACIVRAIPSGSDGRIRISTTLPNRLGKMLSPLHWHDYKKHYGKLDDFVAHHPELFVIEGDFIHLREGAQQIISATTAVAKVAAAAAASSAPYPALLPSVAVTPVAQSIHQKKAPAVDSRSTNLVASANCAAVNNPGDLYDKRPLIPKIHDQQHNGGSVNIIKRLSDVQVSSKLKDMQEPSSLLTENRPGQSSAYIAGGNGRDPDRASLPPHNKGMSNGRHGYGSKQPGRSSAAGLISRR